MACIVGSGGLGSEEGGDRWLWREGLGLWRATHTSPAGRNGFLIRLGPWMDLEGQGWWAAAATGRKGFSSSLSFGHGLALRTETSKHLYTAIVFHMLK